jgi:K+-transporting ATPase ATPase C chain
MSKHIRANLWLLVFTLLMCSVLYPAVLLGIGKVFFPHQVEGSLIRDKDGKVIGSELIAQPFSSPEYFQPRPSATTPAYNAAASGASNYGASNPLLRARVAQQLGPIVSYEGSSPTGNTVQKDIETWFAQWSKDHPKASDGVVAEWADTYPSVAAAWVKTDDAHKDLVKEWMTANDAAVKAFVAAHPDNPQPQPEDLATDFFKRYAQTHPGSFPSYAAPEGKTEKVWQDLKDGSDIQSIFFDMWLREHPDAKLKQVPGDLVMSSASGLDPHITLDNARFQLDGVADAWAKKTHQDRARVRQAIDQLLQEKARAPFGGLVGKPLVNVLEVNLALEGLMEKLAAGSSGNGGPA